MKSLLRALPAVLAVGLGLVLTHTSPAVAGDCTSACSEKQASCNNTCESRRLECVAT